MKRGGVTLVEVLAVLVPAVLVVGVALGVLVHTTFQGDWNAVRLSALDAVLLANEAVRHQARNDGAGGVLGARAVGGTRVVVEWADEGAALLRIRTVAAGGHGPTRAAPIALTALVYLGDRRARTEFASWADE